MKAVALISGGLDSILAARAVKEQGLEIIPLNFVIPFCQRQKNQSEDKTIDRFVKDNLGEELKRVALKEEFLSLIIKPKHGYGSNMNPCIDCKILMLKKTKELMASMDAQFVITGEVLGQRPMSQHKKALEKIEEESGLKGLLLRPLTAKNLACTFPEEKGWINRDKLFDFSGRSRRPQIKLAKEFNLINYPNAAGGCLLTDAQFSHKLRDLIAHGVLSVENVELLKIGRHFRLGDNTKLIVGRNEVENSELEKLAREGDYIFMPNSQLAGPTCIGRGEFNTDLIMLSAQITCRYCDLNSGKSTKIIYYLKDNALNELEVEPVNIDSLNLMRL